jgi:lipid A 3-O-deacylase
MYRLVLFSGLIEILSIFQSCAQRIDNSSTFKTIQTDTYLRMQYDNDYFTRTDKYYTQGIELEYVNPAIKHFLLTQLLFRPKRSSLNYGISLDHMAFTPTNTGTNQILYGDRPFAACLTLKIFAIANDSLRRRRISSALVAGILGPAAGGAEMQTTIHRWLDNPLPMGWQNQIHNNCILNYELNAENELLTIDRVLLLNAAAQIRAGTLNDKVNAGLNFMFGNFPDPYRSSSKALKKKLHYYIYGQPGLSYIGYDASLQGGLFDHHSPYTISNSGISRINFQSDYGFVVCFPRLYLEYCQTYLTKEFKTGTYHRWGGIRIGYAW